MIAIIDDLKSKSIRYSTIRQENPTNTTARQARCQLLYLSVLNSYMDTSPMQAPAGLIQTKWSQIYTAS